jgi:hypothetical protein
MLFVPGLDGGVEAEGFQNLERPPELAGFLAVFQVANEPQSGARNQGQIGLFHAEGFSSIADQPPERFCRHWDAFNGLNMNWDLAIGNKEYSRSGK